MKNFSFLPRAAWLAACATLAVTAHAADIRVASLGIEPKKPGVFAFTVGGAGESEDLPSRRVLVRVLGSGFGKKSAPLNPRVALRGPLSPTPLAANDDWSASAEAASAIRAASAAAGLTALAEGGRDAAFVITLPPGAYFLDVEATDKRAGRARIEIALLDEPGEDTTTLALGQVVDLVRAQSGAPALAVALVTPGQIAKASAGVTRLDAPAPVAENAFYHAGSCGKAMTATLVGMLVENGGLRWDSTLGEIFPELAATADARVRVVTVEQLLQHRGGVAQLGDADSIAELPPFTGTATEQRAQFAAYVLKQPPANPVGEFAYSNGGYALLGAIIERVTGESYEQAMTERLFTPLGM